MTDRPGPSGKDAESMLVLSLYGSTMLQVQAFEQSLALLSLTGG